MLSVPTLRWLPAALSLSLLVGCRSDFSRVLAPRQAARTAAGTLTRAAEPQGQGPCDASYPGPVISLFGPGLEFHYPTGGYCPSCPGAEVPLDVPENHAVTFHWSADASAGCTDILGYRWALDLADVFDETPRINEATDFAHWSTPSLASSATVGPFVMTQGAPDFRYLYVEARDGVGYRSLGIVRIHVVADTNHNPDVSSATAALLAPGPPNGSFSPVRISDVTDPDGDAVTITVIGVSQDEPLLGRGTRPTCPDGRLTQGIAAVRRERSGFGNGRVYTIEFVATDGHGGSTHGTANVCIPHDFGHDACTRDPLIVNSLESCDGPVTCRPPVR